MIVYRVYGDDDHSHNTSHYATKEEALNVAQTYDSYVVRKVVVIDPSEVGGSRELYCRLLDNWQYMQSSEIVDAAGDHEYLLEDA